jgi:hypothetical protein
MKPYISFCAVASNIYHSSVDGQGAMVMAKDTRKLQVKECQTYSDFFERFNKGLKNEWETLCGRIEQYLTPF